MLSLLLLPGMDGTGLLFERFVEALAARTGQPMNLTMDVRIMRYPGDRMQGYEDLVALAQAALPPQGDIVVLGESFSGPVAIALAARSAPRVKGLILCCSFSRNPRPGLARLGGLLRWMPAGCLPGPMLPLAWALMGRHGTRPLRAALKNAMDQVSAPVLKARLQAVLASDATQALRSLRMPLLYLQAAEDLVVPPVAERLIRQACPHGELVRLQGPHFLLQTQPERAAVAVTAFMQGLMGPTPAESQS